MAVALYLQPEPFVVAMLKSWPLNGGTIVDVGCGAGIYRDHVDGRYIGVDHAEVYEGGYPVDVLAEGDDLPFPDGAIDQVMSKGAFFQFSDHDAALAEFRRVLRPGGRLFLFDYNRRTQKDLEVRERASHPCWTALGLGWRVRRAGFRQVGVLLPREIQPSGWRRFAGLVAEELRGQWAVVTAVNP